MFRAVYRVPISQRLLVSQTTPTKASALYSTFSRTSSPLSAQNARLAAARVIAQSPIRNSVRFANTAGGGSGGEGPNSSVGKSQTATEWKNSIKEEVTGSAKDIARGIGGGNYAIDNVKGEATFAEITKANLNAVPTEFMYIGLAGGLPYVGAAISTVYYARQAEQVSVGALNNINFDTAQIALENALHFQVTYGAVLLSFLGAIHWGFEAAQYGGKQGFTRLALGVAPLALAWPTLAIAPVPALITQWATFTALWWADMRATSQGWAPQWYSQYRFYLSILVGACIIGSLAGTSYLGPMGGHGQLPAASSARSMEKLKSFRRSTHEHQKVPEGTEVVQGEGTFLQVRKKEEPKEDEEEQEGGEEGSDAKDDSKSESKDKKEDKKEDKKPGDDEPKSEEKGQDEKAEKQEGETSKADDEKKDEKKK